MSAFEFEREPRPFPRWMGAFSPARGTYSGFRFHQGRLGTWVEGESGRMFWPLRDGSGARAIADLERGEWGGGRVLLLPNGFVVKPLPGEEEVGLRVLIGWFRESIVLERPGGSVFDLSRSDHSPGDAWKGPKTTGLECAIDQDGTHKCSWYHPTVWGRDEVSERLRGPDPSLAMEFRKARPGDLGGRVRITANGHVITNRQEQSGSWATFYVGWIDPGSWTDWQKWITKERT